MLNRLAYSFRTSKRVHCVCMLGPLDILSQGLLRKTIGQRIVAKRGYALTPIMEVGIKLRAWLRKEAES